LQLINVIFKHFDRNRLKRELLMRKGAKGALELITSRLAVSDVVASYNLSSLLTQYHPGSRQWMYDRVNSWLDAQAAAASAAAGKAAPPRLFLLLADAGMGKSVFSSVMAKKLVVRTNGEPDLVLVQHFFKVGQRRGQGRAMVLCLALQLAEEVEGFAACLEPVVKEHGDGSGLPWLSDVFEKFLLEPLASLDRKRAATETGPGLHRPRVLILLDALDESDDGGAGWEPVTRLVANQ
jgi:hypothetical protein